MRTIPRWTSRLRQVEEKAAAGGEEVPKLGGASPWPRRTGSRVRRATRRVAALVPSPVVAPLTMPTVGVAARSLLTPARSSSCGAALHTYVSGHRCSLLLKSTATREAGTARAFLALAAACTCSPLPGHPSPRHRALQPRQVTLAPTAACASSR
ncbi:unnamed protein product [Urochloa humidicola]